RTGSPAAGFRRQDRRASACSMEPLRNARFREREDPIAILDERSRPCLTCCLPRFEPPWLFARQEHEMISRIGGARQALMPVRAFSMAGIYADHRRLGGQTPSFNEEAAPGALKQTVR